MIDNAIIVEIDIPNEIDVDLGEAKFITAPARKVPQATPEIHISESGLITASATQEEGMVLAGTKSAELQMPTKGGAIIEPSKESQVVIGKGQYAVGDILVNPISDEYIKPSGTLEITQNNKEYDVSAYAKANVQIHSQSKLPQVVDGSVTELKTEDFGDIIAVCDYAFCNCKSLEWVELPDTIGTMGQNVFRGCEGLVVVNIPNSIKEIPSYTFYECTNLSDITIPDGVTKINEYAFCKCKSFTYITIPEGVTNIGTYAFGYCDGLTHITIPASVTYMGQMVFRDCKKLASVEFAKGTTIKEMGFNTFYGMTALESITIPASVTSIRQDSFAICSNLRKVTLLCKSPPTLHAKGFGSTTQSNAITYYVPAESVEAYKAATNWAVHADRIFAIEG